MDLGRAEGVTMRIGAHHLQIQTVRFHRPARRLYRSGDQVLTVVSLPATVIIDIDEFGTRYALGASAIRDLKILFGSLATKQELLANARRPSRIR